MSVEEPEYISRSAAKRQERALQALAKQLLELHPDQLRALPISRCVAEAIEEGRGMTSYAARKRQAGHLAGMLRFEDAEAIRSAVGSGKAFTSARDLQLQRLERWRDRLLAGGDEVLEQFIQEHPEADRQRLRTLCRQVRRDQERSTETPRSYKQLFQVLKESLDRSTARAAAE